MRPQWRGHTGRALGRRTLLVLVLAAAALGAALRADAANPPARAMVLTKDDLGAGALVLYQGAKIAPVFAPVVEGMKISDRYSRTLTEAKLGPLDLPQVYSSAVVRTNAGEVARLVRDLSLATTPGASRRAFIEGMQRGAGSGTSVTLVRARKLRLADDAIELILHVKTSSGAVELAEVWVRKGHAVSAAAAVSPRPLTAGQSFTLAKVVAGHLMSAAA